MCPTDGSSYVQNEVDASATGSSSRGTFIGLLVAAALVAGLIAAVAIRGRKTASADHALKGSLQKRMKLFGRLAAEHKTERPPRRYEEDVYLEAPENGVGDVV